jgi:hypothetical protein
VTVKERFLVSTTPETDSADDDATGAEQYYASLDDAFRDKKTTLANQAFIRRLLSSIKVEGYAGRSGYIKVVRGDGYPAVQVHSGYSNGFQTEAEITRGVGDVDRWLSRRLRGTWGVTHPENQLRDGNSERHTKKEAQPCPDCGSVMPLSGTCDLC